MAPGRGLPWWVWIIVLVVVAVVVLPIAGAFLDGFATGWTNNR